MNIHIMLQPPLLISQLVTQAFEAIQLQYNKKSTKACVATNQHIHKMGHKSMQAL